MYDKVKKIATDIASLLYWGMMATGTIGPGTIVTCAKAGAEHKLHLAWVLVFASILAFILTVCIIV